MSAKCETFGGMIVPAAATPRSTTACTLPATSTLTDASNAAGFVALAGQLTLALNRFADLLKSIGGSCLSSVLLNSSSSVLQNICREGKKRVRAVGCHVLLWRGSRTGEDARMRRNARLIESSAPLKASAIELKKPRRCLRENTDR